MGTPISKSSITLATIATILTWCQGSAHEQGKSAREIQSAKEDGSYDERAARIQNLKQFKMSEATRQRAIYKMQRAALQASGLTETEAAKSLASGPLMAFPFTAQPELRASGTVKTLTILIDFKDHKSANEFPGMSVSTVQNNIYGTGTADAQAFKPLESVHNYYDRASQGKVDLQGNVLGWHHFPNDQLSYSPTKANPALPPLQRRQKQAELDNSANFKLVADAMTALDATTDFSQYDNDNDGDIDLVTIMYAGPDYGWGSFWWAYRWEFFVPESFTKKFDGKRVKQFVFQFVSKRGTGGKDFDPTTLMHETGHAFGLTDYYDYDDGQGPQGGVGGLDMMDANQGNQNAFSRWLLDWIKPTVIGAGAPAIKQLVASGSNQNGIKAIAVFPGLSNASSPDQEMFIIENRHRIGNDANLPGDGMLIWHVNAAVNSSNDDFENDNSFTDTKLIQLVRADNDKDFNSSESASATTYYKQGKKFTPTSVPSSKSTSGNATNIVVDEISAAGETMSVKIGILNPGGAHPAPVPVLAAAVPQNADAGAAEAAAPAYHALATAAADAPIDLDKLEDLDRKFAAATPDQLQKIWQETDRKELVGPSVTSSSIAMQLLLSHWASKQGKTAVEALLQLPQDRNFVQTTFPKLMVAWANQAPKEAAEWYFSGERAPIRESKMLNAGGDFTKKLFQQVDLDKSDEFISNINTLQHTSEVVGAIEGLRNASKRVEDGRTKLDKKLKKVDGKGNLIHATQHYLDAVDEARDAAKEIKDRKQRRDFNGLIESKSRN